MNLYQSLIIISLMAGAGVLLIAIGAILDYAEKVIKRHIKRFLRYAANHKRATYSTISRLNIEKRRC